MKLLPDKLDAHLAKRTAPVYLLHGDEPLQLDELTDTLRRHARAHGFLERRVHHPVDDTSWLAFRESVESLSLFAERRLIELRLPGGKPGRRGSALLTEHAEAPPPDVLLLVICGKLDHGTQSSKWFKALDKAGVSLAVQPVVGRDLSDWLDARLSRHGLQATPEALALIAERVEGNLLAARQEIERLALLVDGGVLDVEAVWQAVSDNARYTINDLMTAALAGDAARTARVVAGLRDEGAAAALLLWAIAQEVRGAARAAEAVAEGADLDVALQAAGVWSRRAVALKPAIRRLAVGRWLELLSAAAHADRLLKGRGQGELWDVIESLALGLAGAVAPVREDVFGPAVYRL